MDRRSYLKALASGSTVALAGCATNSEPGEGATPTAVDAPTPTITGRPTRTRTATRTPTDASTETPTDGPTETETPTAERDYSHLEDLDGSTLPDSSVIGYHDREFEQSFPGGSSTYSVSIPKSAYQYYADRPRVGEYAAYLSDTFDEPYLQSIADTFEDYGEEHGHSDRQIVDHTIAWVQGMEYSRDQAATGYNEYPKYPVETIVDRGGDCEDTSILLAGVLQKLGYGTRLLLLRDADHMAVGVAGGDDLAGSYYTDDGRKFYYLETTGEGWQVGEIPKSVREQGSDAELISLGKYPTLAMEWETSETRSGTEVDLTIANVGLGTARSVVGQVDVQDGNGDVVAQDRQTYPDLASERQATGTLSVRVPQDTEVSFTIGALNGGTVMDVHETAPVSP